ncbi:hypothetical protein FD755_007681, partial [Muntiacus reevesi]
MQVHCPFKWVQVDHHKKWIKRLSIFRGSIVVRSQALEKMPQVQIHLYQSQLCKCEQIGTHTTLSSSYISPETTFEPKNEYRLKTRGLNEIIDQCCVSSPIPVPVIPEDSSLGKLRYKIPSRKSNHNNKVLNMSPGTPNKDTSTQRPDVCFCGGEWGWEGRVDSKDGRVCIPLSFSQITAIKIHSCCLPGCFLHSVLCNMHLNILSGCSFSKLDSFAANIPLVSELAIDDIHFDDFSLDVDAMITAALRMFMELGMVQKFKIDYETLCRWLLTVRKNYRMVLYHNWRHAFNVCQLMFAMLTVSVSGSALAQLYGTSATLEHHHFNHAVMILQSEGHNIFANLSSKEYSDLMQLLKQSILATDLTLYFERRTEFFELVSKGEYDWNIKNHRDIFRSMLMTACDLGAVTKPWEISRQVAELVTSEFFEQGDRERAELKLTPSAIFDRNRKDELPRLQLEWIDSICMPLYQ